MIVCMFFLSRGSKAYKEWCEEADEIGFYVQEHGGSLATTRHGVEFTMPGKYHTFLKIKYPQLEEIELIC